MTRRRATRKKAEQRMLPYHLAAERRIASIREAGGTSLNLSHLKLSRLPESIRDLTGLNSLILDGCELSELPDWIGELNALTHLSLRAHTLLALPESMASLTNLTNLCLRVWDGEMDNGDWELNGSPDGLPELPTWVGDLANLTNLNLAGNNLTTLPESVGNLTNLTSLDLSNNPLEELPESLGNLANLTSLDLRGSTTLVPPDWIGNLTALTRLNLGLTWVTELPESMKNLINLTSLNLSRNELKVLPNWIGNLTNLTELDLRDNQLKTLPLSIGNLANLTTLLLANNPLINPPPEVVGRGKRAVLAYVRASRRGTTRQWAAKLLVVGEGGVGKTSLVKALAGRDHDPDEPTTHGMQISGFRLDHPSEDNVGMELSVWDFGGQQIYHATHQFFLTDQSLVLLVWNPRAGHLQSRVRYWLDIITSRAPGAPIILVASHGDEGRPSDLPLTDLKRHYPRLVGSLTVDSRSGTGFQALLAEVTMQAARLPNMGLPWPDEWTAVAARLAEDTRTYVTDREMRGLMTETGVFDTDDQSLLAGLLQQRGVILRHDGPGNATDVVVLQPEWLNSRISRILDMNDSVPATRTGLLTQADRDREWADIEPVMREYFLDMMETYDLAYRTADPAEPSVIAVVVELLPHQAPDYTDMWSKAGGSPGSNELHVRYDLAVVPPGIPTWFIAREHRFTMGIHWRTGVLLRDREGLHLALMHVDIDNKTVNLAVRGPLPQGFFAVLSDGLNLLLDRYPGLAVRRSVQCPCSSPGRCTEFFDYSKLMARLGRGRTDVECDATGELVPIVTLLAGIAPTRRAAGPVAESHVERIIDQLGVSQREIIKAIHAGQKAHCPSVFTVVPSNKRRLGKTLHILRLYCEEPDAWHPLSHDEGCYEITELDAWLAKYGRIAQRVLAFLSKAIPVAGAATGLAAHVLDGQLKRDMDKMHELLSHKIPSGLDTLDPDPNHTLLLPDPLDPRARAASDADFRVLASMLHDLDPHEHWGGLNRTSTPEGLTLYLCRNHAGSYE